MNRFVCLLRGVNVGGHNKVKMATLREAVTQAGLRDVATYIQSGNIVFRADGDCAELSETIGRVIEKSFGFRPRLQVLRAETLETMVASCPYAKQAAENPKAVHAFFLGAEPRPEDLVALAQVDDEGGAFQHQVGVVFLHAPDGLSKSKLGEVMERKLNVPMTARNWRTVLTLQSMLAEL